MTKLQILTSPSHPVVGFDYINLQPTEQLDSKLSSYSDNQCELILAAELIDQVESENINEILSKICSKLRLGGKLVVGGTDLNLFCKSVNNDLINEKSASHHVGACKSMLTISSVEKLLAGLGLQLEYSRINGTTYEVSGIRR
jgi:predicted SAM-dependent methyltransferase